MAEAQEPRLIEILLAWGKIDMLDGPSKRALRLCNKQFKSLVDAKVMSSKVEYKDVHALLNCAWHLKKLCIHDMDFYTVCYSPTGKSLPSLSSALISKFPLLEFFSIKTICSSAALLTDVGELKHLKVLEINCLWNPATLSPSFGQLTALEKLVLVECGQVSELKLEELAPVKQFHQLKHLTLFLGLVGDKLFPEWIGSCDFPFLEDLSLSHLSYSLFANNFEHDLERKFQHLTGGVYLGREQEMTRMRSSSVRILALAVYQEPDPEDRLHPTYWARAMCDHIKLYANKKFNIP